MQGIAKNREKNRPCIFRADETYIEVKVKMKNLQEEKEDIYSYFVFLSLNLHNSLVWLPHAYTEKSGEKKRNNNNKDIGDMYKNLLGVFSYLFFLAFS